MSSKKLKQKKCLNCGYPFGETKFNHYCPNCGQENTTKNIGIWNLLIDFLGDYFTFDSKLFRSLYFLIGKPGFLTNEFNEGKRIRYIPPLRMYLFISVIFFFMIPYFASEDNDGIVQINLEDDFPENIRQVLFDYELLQSKYTITTDSLEKIKISEKMKAMKTAFLDSINFENNEEIVPILYIGAYMMEPAEILKKLDLENNTANRFLVRRGMRIVSGGTEAINRFFYNNISIAVFLMLPAFALLLKLLYIRRKQLYIGHLIFAFHFHSFCFLTLGLLFLALNLSGHSISLFLLASTIYLFLALKRVYEQGIFKTLVKQFLLFIAYFITVTLFLLIFVLISLLLA